MSCSTPSARPTSSCSAPARPGSRSRSASAAGGWTCWPRAPWAAGHLGAGWTAVRRAGTCCGSTRAYLAVAGELGDAQAIACRPARGRTARAARRPRRAPDPFGPARPRSRRVAHSRARVLTAAVCDRRRGRARPGSSLGAQSGLSVERALALDLVRTAVAWPRRPARRWRRRPPPRAGRSSSPPAVEFGQVFARTTNPPEATGDGLACAARGARLADLELSFHPTALDRAPTRCRSSPGAPRRRGHPRGRLMAGGSLADAGPEAELLARDVVARALWSALAPRRVPRRPHGGGGVPGALPDRVRGLSATRPRPAHFRHPGRPLPHGRSGRRPRYGIRRAAGEVACTGSTAPRLASTLQVVGARVAEALARPCRTCAGRPRARNRAAIVARRGRRARGGRRDPKCHAEKAGLVRTGRPARAIETLEATLRPAPRRRAPPLPRGPPRRDGRTRAHTRAAAPTSAPTTPWPIRLGAVVPPTPEGALPRLETEPVAAPPAARGTRGAAAPAPALRASSDAPCSRTSVAPATIMDGRDRAARPHGAGSGARAAWPVSSRAPRVPASGSAVPDRRAPPRRERRREGDGPSLA